MMFGRGQREDLDDEEGIAVSTAIRAEISKEVEALEKRGESVQGIGGEKWVLEKL
jgi:hypothetical protein